MMDSKSEIANFRQQQALEEAAAQQGLHGYAQVATHESITARAERGAARIMRLVDKGKHDEAKRLMNTPDWGLAEEEASSSHTADAEQR